ncbi:TlpA family protein disulfide reductase [candidate division KSB1 bacterium]|nr:TlpA family protein disulfide reductase [candidate division KSB1 bacterium]
MSRKTIGFTAAILAVGIAAYLSLSAKTVEKTLHAVGHTLGSCASACGTNGTVAAQDNASPACTDGPGCNISIGDKSGVGYTENEREIIGYVSDQIVAGKDPSSLSPEKIEKATGISLEGVSVSRLQAGVLAELARRDVDVDRLFGANNCVKFSACSVEHDLSNATGEELKRYELEKSQDGATFADWRAPDFTLPTTAGYRVRLSELRGKPVALVFLSGHCNHSHDTLPILAELNAKYESQGLTILPVFVNSGSVEDIKSWTSELNLGYDLMVSESKDISQAYDSRMVPSTFLIDREGRITKKFVGYKDKSTLDQAFGELIGR